MSSLLPLGMAVPIFAAALGAVFSGSLRTRQVISLAASTFVLCLGVALIVATADGTVHVHRIGGFPGDVAIVFVADTLAALLVTVAGLMVVACTAFAIAAREDQAPFFHPLVSVLLAGIANAFLTGDLFNLFVSFEVMLIASYVLLVQRGGERHIRAGAVYVMTNLLATTGFVAGIALTYGVAGSVSLAVLAGADERAIAVPIALVLVAFSVKAGLAPLHGWLTRAYPDTSPAVAALFSGLLTKVGIYSIMRVTSFAGVAGARTVWLVVACITMLVGVLGAVSQTGMRRILSFHIVSQVGYMVMGLGLPSLIGLTGGIFYIVHHIVVKTSLFLSAAATERLHGTGELQRLGALMRGHPILAAAFGVAALSLAGVPPLSGFAAKLVLIQAAFVDGYPIVAMIALFVGLLTLTSMAKIWNGAFWGTVTRGDPHVVEPKGAVPTLMGGASDDLEPLQRFVRTGVHESWSPAALIAPAAVLAAISVVMGLGAEVAIDLSREAARGLIDPSAYIEGVLGR